ncbi:hypothetical protein BGL87_04430 [Helicobacter pylori]|nr:hypothetical protein BGL87_04430 [Helicobacter pylori]
MGFYIWKKHGFFKCFPYFIGFIVNAFFDLVGFIGLIFVVIGIDRNNIFLNKSLIFVFFSYNKI